MVSGRRENAHIAVAFLALVDLLAGQEIRPIESCDIEIVAHGISDHQRLSFGGVAAKEGVECAGDAIANRAVA